MCITEDEYNSLTKNKSYGTINEPKQDSGNTMNDNLIVSYNVRTAYQLNEKSSIIGAFTSKESMEKYVSLKDIKDYTFDVIELVEVTNSNGKQSYMRKLDMIKDTQLESMVQDQKIQDLLSKLSDDEKELLKARL